MNNKLLKLAMFLSLISAWILFIKFGYNWSTEVDTVWAMLYWLGVSSLLVVVQIGIASWEVKNNLNS